MIDLGNPCVEKQRVPDGPRRSCCAWRRNNTLKARPLREFHFGNVGGDASPFVSNTVKTSKYTLLTFVPLLLLSLFSKKAYLYFLVIAVLVFIPIISPVKPYGPVAALAFLVLVSAVREGIEDWKRHMEDRMVNNAVCRVLRGAKGESEAVPWREVVVGDVVEIESGELLPADVVLLASSDPKGLAFVSTVGLDGETNAKMKRVCDPENGRCEGFDRTGSVRSEAPNRDLSAFTGTLTWDGCEGKTVSLDNQCIFYRGSRLVTTSRIIGVVVFTGRDTKIMQNFEGAATRFKVTSLDRRIDRYILIVFAILFALCLGSALANGILYENVARTLVYLQPWSDSPAVSGVINFFTFFILYSGIVPLAMYVSMELVKVVHAVMMNWDLDLCLDQQASRAKSALSAELGCVQHLFSDKTGTLTRNEMVLRHLCGRDGVAKSPAAAVVEEEALCLALVLCHTVQTGESKGERLTYDAESPDEKALVTGLAEAGGKSFVFAGREVVSDGRSQFVSLLNGVRFELLATLEFSSDRKMMSVIVRAPDGGIVVYCKGAEQVVFERLCRGTSEQGAVEAAGKCLESFTLQGLRTLAVASRRVTEAEYSAWAVRYLEASVSMERRTERVRAACDEMECELTLLGVTAVEDRLQDAVPETIAALLGAGIKVWMITGDHRDTAVNIGRACHLVSGSLTKLVDAGDEAEAVALLGSASRERNGVIVIDGKTLEHVLGSEALRELFVHVCDSARSIVCCRVSPKQKGQIVALMRSSRHVVTMAVGDGSNDVAMLREADIGVGLFGKEGRQAVMASDYAIAQFRFLGPLMLFHGRESYHRIVFLLLYSFYKGIQFAMLSFWFALFNLFSGQTLFESWHFGLYHVLFTSLPILVFAVTNRDAGPRSSGRLFPKLYGRDTFSVAALAAWLVRGVVDSAAIFFVCVFAFGEGSVGPSTGWCYGLFSTGIACLTASIVVVNAKLAMGVTWWTWPMLGSLVLTVAVWFGFTMLVAVTSNSGADWSMFYVSVNVMVLPVFWLAVLLAFSLCMFYELLIWRLGFYLWPSDSDVVRRLQKGASDTWTE